MLRPRHFLSGIFPKSGFPAVALGATAFAPTRGSAAQAWRLTPQGVPSRLGQPLSADPTTPAVRRDYAFGPWTWPARQTASFGEKLASFALSLIGTFATSRLSSAGNGFAIVWNIDELRFRSGERFLRSLPALWDYSVDAPPARCGDDKCSAQSCCRVFSRCRAAGWTGRPISSASPDRQLTKPSRRHSHHHHHPRSG